MVELRYKDSAYRFTDPIRYFKANDPIYYEVENIPLKQLHENSLWLKDQLRDSIQIEDIDRSGFSELKPYVNENDNIIRVKPGRFTARINSVYNIEPLQLLYNLLGTEIGDYNSWIAAALNNMFLNEFYLRVMNGTEDSGYNGLIERCFSYPAVEPDRAATNFISNTEPTIVNLTNNLRQAFPISEAQLWNSVATGYGSDSFYIRQYNNTNPTVGFASMGVAETAFIKKWRGVARTSVVDVAEETSIEIPAYDPQDFYYTDVNGEKVLIPATQRIDLVFMYSKPVDMSGVTLAKYVNGQPVNIVKPTLGIVRGAGLGLDRRAYTENAALKSVKAIKEDGTSMMFASPGDATNTYMGFQGSGIRGSFPSPDDLMNLTPLLSEQLESTNFALIGQSILPIAYIVVRKDAAANEGGSPVIRSADVIDIRPFFRTAELSYNERAGIAAAVPAISLANPVVGQSELDFEVKRVYTDLLGRINSTRTQALAEDKPRVVGGGYVKGGYYFGVEGVLGRYIENRLSPGSTKEAIKQQIVARYGLPTGIEIPDYPDWDLAYWVGRNNLSNPGGYPNDYINLHQWGSLNGHTGQSRFDRFNGVGNEFSTYIDDQLTTRLARLGTDKSGYWNGNLAIFYVKKTILLDRARVDNWMGDYHVNVQLWNCAPLSCAQHADRDARAAGTNSIWVEKKRDRFTIYVAWVAADWAADSSAGKPAWIPGTGNNVGLNIPQYTRNGEYHSGFVVINQDIANATYALKEFEGESNAGITTYPSVTYQVIGYPSTDGANLINANSQGVYLTLK